ncbi:hypothetical protein DQK91_18615 [Oceanidesulfovibrio marinus]|uniref:Uncharacterized protein n=1 Tax=Oceanidesulfovibrio marinus TaxID=370038 RepID=A0A6P1ZDH9_9BACT|nr:hypothetical protein DQK91_18615 [Oceanidesulfovibrio marinus]
MWFLLLAVLMNGVVQVILKTVLKVKALICILTKKKCDAALPHLPHLHTSHRYNRSPFWRNALSQGSEDGSRFLNLEEILLDGSHS